MEGTMSEIRLFSGNFAPQSWAFCNGSAIAISSNQALFALLGTTYGGNGVTTFNLPDLRGRTVIGQGAGPGLSAYAIGQTVGIPTETLTLSQLPMHTHMAQVTAGTGTASGSATLYGVNAGGGHATPGGNYLAEDNGAGATSYASSGTPVAMNAGSAAITDIHAVTTVSIGTVGGSQPHENMQPSLALNYIICVYGIFPSRN